MYFASFVYYQIVLPFLNSIFLFLVIKSIRVMFRVMALTGLVCNVIGDSVFCLDYNLILSYGQIVNFHFEVRKFCL